MVSSLPHSDVSHHISREAILTKSSQLYRGCVKRRCGASRLPNRTNAFSLLIELLAGHVQPRHHRLKAEEYRTMLQGGLHMWNEVTNVNWSRSHTDPLILSGLRSLSSF